LYNITVGGAILRAQHSGCKGIKSLKPAWSGKGGPALCGQQTQRTLHLKFFWKRIKGVEVISPAADHPRSKKELNIPEESTSSILQLHHLSTFHRLDSSPSIHFFPSTTMPEQRER
jgi:hypothetical protein